MLNILNFKTSYVTVYQAIDDFEFKLKKFQNIVCYCLSSVRPPHTAAPEISKHRMLLFILHKCTTSALFDKFQNIVCYCLSEGTRDISRIMTHFKTSYVTVYPLLWSAWQLIYHYFKTSYVTVYHICHVNHLRESIISKHRMLLFICIGYFVLYVL